MAWLTIFGTILGPALGGLMTAIGAMLKNTSFVLILLGASLGFHFGDEYGRWRQTGADKITVKNGGQPVTPRVRPIRDLIHFVVGAEPGEEDEE